MTGEGGMLFAVLAAALPVATALRLARAWARAGFDRVERALATGCLSLALFFGGWHLLGGISFVTGSRLVGVGSLALIQAIFLALSYLPRWIPAFARMTRGFARMTRGFAGMKRGSAGMTGKGSGKAQTQLPSSLSRDRIPLRLLWIAVAVLAPGFLMAWAAAASRPPAGADALYYHLPLASNWLRAGTLDIEGIVRPPTARHIPVNIGVFCYPANGSLLSMVPLSAGIERAVSFIQVPLLALALLALYAIARRLNQSPAAALLVAVAFASTPMAILQTTVAQNDMLVAASVLMSFAFLLAAADDRERREERTHRRRRLLAVLAAGAAAGIAAGTKLNGLASAAALGCALMAGVVIPRLIGTRRRPGRPGEAAALLAVFVATLAASSVFWYARNEARFGSALYPYGIHLFGKELVVGNRTNYEWRPERLADIEEAASINPWRVKRDFSYRHGLGALYATLIPLAACFAGYRLVRRLRRRRAERANPADVRGSPDRPPLPFAALLLLVFVLVDLAVWRLLSNQSPRYILADLALACLPLGAALDSLRGRWRTVSIPALILFLAGINALGVAAATLQSTNPDTSFSRSPNRERFYGIPAALDSLPIGSIVLNDLDSGGLPIYFNYPLFGRRLDHGVSNDVPPENCSPAEAWTFLESMGTGYVFSHVLGDQPFPARWDDPRLFRVITEETREASDWYAGRFQRVPDRRGLLRLRIYQRLPGGPGAAGGVATP